MENHTHTHTRPHVARRETKSAIIQRAAATAGTLSRPSKMPCHCYSLPAAECITGTKLRANAASTCAKCYAMRGNYARPNVRDAMQRRLDAVRGDLDQWAAAMIEQIRAAERSEFFRWHDSGDIQSAAHLLAIFDVCDATPHLMHWLPTRELSFVREALAERERPINLIIRLSAFMRGAPPSAALAERLGVHTSTVDHATGATCEAGKRGGVCGECRACWQPAVANVNYPLH